MSPSPPPGETPTHGVGDTDTWGGDPPCWLGFVLLRWWERRSRASVSPCMNWENTPSPPYPCCSPLHHRASLTPQPPPNIPPTPSGPPGRFQQVQALAATADAFFCLYSYVSRTPVQRISPSRLAWACTDVPNIRIAPTQPSTLSPVERLKKAVSTMCLYTSPRDEDSPRGTSRLPTVPTSQPSAMGKVVQEVLERAREERFRFDPADVLEGWGRDGDAGMAQHQRGSPPVSPSLRLVQGVPACPRHGGVDDLACCGGEREPSPRPAPVGTPVGAAQGHLERSCPHGGGSGDSPAGVAQGAGDAPCPVGAGRISTEENQPDTAANVTLSATPAPMAPHSGQLWVTPEHPEGLGSEGDSGFGSGSWGTSPRRKAGSHGCHPGDPLDPAGARSPCSDTPRAGGHRARRSRGWRRGGPLRDAGWQQGDAPGLQTLGKGPSPHRPSWQEPVDSFEMEEVRVRCPGDGHRGVGGRRGLGEGGSSTGGPFGWQVTLGEPACGGKELEREMSPECSQAFKF